MPDHENTRVRGTEILATDTPQQYREKLARIALDEMYQFVAVLDPQGTLLEVNRAALESAGLQPVDVEHKPFWECFGWAASDEIQQGLKAAIQRASRGELVRYDIEIYGRAHGRETIIIDLSMTPVTDEAGRVVFIIPEGRDITEKKAQERELAQKNVELQTLLERIRELGELKPQGFANVNHELREDGTQAFLTKPFTEQDLLVRVHDLYDVRRAQERERKETAVNEALYRVAASFAEELDQQKLLQLVTDEATTLTGAEFGAFFFNATGVDGGEYLLYTLSGAPPEAFAGFPMPRATPLFGPTFRGEGVIRLDDVRTDPRYGKMGPQPAGHLPVVSYLAIPVIGRGGEVFGGLFFGHGQPARFTEVHERIVRGLAAQAAAALAKARLYEALRASEARAREADQRKDEFLAMLGHELRNPLAPIMTALDLMTMRGNGHTTEEQQVIERQVKHLSRLVDDLLDIARVTRGKIQIHRQRINLGAVVERAVEISSPLFEQRGHRLRVAVPRTGLELDADPERLAQVVSNLLTNAAKYTDPGGSVVLAAEAHGDHIAVSVKDNGQGISPELLPRIFELFVQDKRSSERAQGGLGIGLALVRNLVELHGGRVEARSEGPGCGSEFVIELPAACGAIEHTPATSATSPRARLDSRILLVDDNVDAVNMLAEALSILGHDVRVAHDGAQALAVAESFQPTTAVLDIGLPVMDGYELARILRERWRDRSVWFVALTGYGQESDKEKAKAAGFDVHLVKPIKLAELAAVIQARDGPLRR